MFGNMLHHYVRLQATWGDANSIGFSASMNTVVADFVAYIERREIAL